jgi:hypothetical protein
MFCFPTFLSKNLKIKTHRTINLSVVLCGCEIKWLTVGEERTLRVFEKRGLTRIFGSKTDVVTGQRRKLRVHIEELSDL